MFFEFTKGAAGLLLAAAMPIAASSMAPEGDVPAAKPPQGEKRDATEQSVEPTVDLGALEKVNESCWSELRGKRIYFAHQAVGSEILTGLRDLARRKPIFAMTITAYAEPDRTDGAMHSVFESPALVEGNAGRRGNPEKKIDEFASFLRSSEGANVDVAILKLCYGDIGRMTDAEELFGRYTKAIEDIRRERPKIHFIHCTVPLKAEEHGAKGRLKRLVGTGSDASNATRSRYNEMVRQRFPSDQVLDLAAAESKRPDGTIATVEVGGKRVQVLADEYSDDGAHLNRFGQLVVAREFLLALSRQCGGTTPPATVTSVDVDEAGNRE
ncbi:MAG: hypothetical protein RLZZ116_2257 [Planctomycetota bacterium]|jgi:hypothetical protein